MINEILKMDNVRIIHRNFSGEASKFNREGDRNFSVIIDNHDVAQQLLNDGWNVKIKPPKEDGDEPLCFLPVKVKYNNEYKRLNPTIYLRTGSAKDANIKYKDCFDNQVVSSHPSQNKKVEPGTRVHLKYVTRMIKLGEDTVGILDDIDISNVDLDIRPFNYDVNGKTGVAAYLESMCVTQVVDRFALRYSDESTEE